MEYTGEIELVTQGEKECGLAVAAMVSECPLDFVKNKAVECGLWDPARPGMSDIKLDELLFNLGLTIKRKKYTGLRRNRVYIIVVPSINMKYGNHYIVLDTRFSEKYDGEIAPDKIVMAAYDPNNGVVGKESYTATDLISWSAVVEIKNWRVSRDT